MKVDPLDADVTMADVNAAAATLRRFSGAQRRAGPGCDARTCTEPDCMKGVPPERCGRYRVQRAELSQRHAVGDDVLAPGVA